MASVYEKTLAKNLEGIHQANQLIAALGSLYDPTNPLIKKAALLAFEDGLAARMEAVNEKIPLEDRIVGEKMKQFKLVRAKMRGFINAAEGQSLGRDFLDRLKATARRINGVTVSKTTPDTDEDDPSAAAASLGKVPDPAPPPTHSVSNRSYAGILENLDLMDEQLKSNDGYAPNEEEVQPAAFTGWVGDLRALQNDSLAAKLDTRTARADRNQFGDDPNTGLVARMNAFKAYISTILPRNDPRLKQIKKLRFAPYNR